MRRSSSRFLPVLSLAVVTACSSGSPTTPPTPAPPTPPPAPTPTPTPLTACQRIGPGVGENNVRCLMTSPSFLTDVDKAISQLVKDKPTLFDLNNQRGAEGYFVKGDVDEYFNGVVKNLNDNGLCAVVDRSGEIAVKDDNDSSDQYHILLSSGHIRRGQASYRATCFPAWF
jgi:hypothetical protein